MGTIESILSFVKTRLRITTTDEDMGMLDLINETIRTFDCFETYVKKRCPLKREESGRFCLPEDFYHEIIVEGVCKPFLGASDISPNNIPQQNLAPILYYDAGYLNNAGVNGGFPNGYQRATCQINGTKLDISGAFGFVQGVVLTYEAYNVDEYGRFNAPVNFELAVAERIITEYMHDHRKNYASDTIAYHEKRADTLFSSVKSKSVIRDFRRNYAQIIDIANAILIDKVPNGGGNYGYGN